MVVICLLAFNRVATRPKIHNKLTRGERVIAGSSPGLRISTAMEEDDERREAAIASSPALQPNFTPKKGLSPAQISKFQELHRRRLKIKAKSKIKNKSKDTNAKFKERLDEKSVKTVEDPRVTLSISNTKDLSPSQEDNLVEHTLSKKRQKLHWGLDTKERWERKSNM